jgi:transposase InsO family protein
VDVKVVKVARRKCFQYTALDDCTRLRVLRLYPRQNQFNSLEFLGELRRAFPFSIRRLQTDNGTNSHWPSPWPSRRLASAIGTFSRATRSRTARSSGVTGSNAEEFWDRHDSEGFDEATTALRGWEEVYNHFRFSMALHGKTPAEKLAAVLPAV